MNTDKVIMLGTDALYMILEVSMPMLVVALAVGVMISLFQAVTQIQEMTLTFVPKIIAVFIVIVVAAPWYVEKMVSYTKSIFLMIPSITG